MAAAAQAQPAGGNSKCVDGRACRKASVAGTKHVSPSYCAGAGANYVTQVMCIMCNSYRPQTIALCRRYDADAFLSGVMRDG
jgi:hypothetical protein